MVPYDRNRPWRRSPLPPGWPKIRRRILERDNYLCQIRDMTVCVGTATDVDHIGDRGDHGNANLQSACGPCHDRKTGQTNAAKRPQRRRAVEGHPGAIVPAHPQSPSAPRAWRIGPDGRLVPIE